MIGVSFALALATADPAYFDAVRAVDARMAAIGYRLATANAPLCDALAPTPGLAIHAIAQYAPGERAGARAAFGFAAPVAVEAVVPGSPAASAGVLPDDGLLAVAGDPVTAAIPPAASAEPRDQALAAIARQPSDRPLALTLLRGERPVRVTLAASPGCRSGFEVLLGPGLQASSDGRIVQVSVRFFERYRDEEVAAVIAHELAHTILRHADRLEAAGVKRGLLAEVGRNGRLFRRTEDEADLLGAHLLRNAGYDPQVAVRFWRDHGGEVDRGLFRARTHRSARVRAERIAAELAALPAEAPIPYRPPILATRDSPLE